MLLPELLILSLNSAPGIHGKHMSLVSYTRLHRLDRCCKMTCSFILAAGQQEKSLKFKEESMDCED